MSRHFNFRYITTPVIYILVITGLLAIQFSKGEIFTDRFSAVTITGTFISGKVDKSSDLATLDIAIEGINLRFNSKTPLLTVDTNGNTSSVPLIGYSKNKDKLEILFEQGIKINIPTASSSGSFYIGLESPSEQSLKGVSLFYQPLEGAEFSYSRNLPALTGVYNDHRFLTSLPGNGEFDTTASRLTIPFSTQSIVISPLDDSTNLLKEWYSNQEVPITTARYNELLDEYIGNAYQGWANRFNSSTGTWTHKNGEDAFDQYILAAFMAENFKLGGEARNLIKMRTAASLHPDKNGMLSMPFVGDIRQVATRYAEDRKSRLDALSKAILRKDTSVFQNTDLVEFLLYNEAYSLYENIKQQVNELDFAQMDSSSAAGLAYNYYYQNVSPRLNQDLAGIQNILYEVLLQRIVKLDQGLFYTLDNTSININDSILAGLVIMKAGIEALDNVLTAIGQEIIVSSLRLQEEHGYLPEALQYSNNRIVKKEGHIAPESLYPFIRENNYYPHAYSLYDQYGPGHYIWTAATVIPRIASPAELRFDVEYKLNRAHFFIVYGIENYSAYRMLSKDWPEDHRFETYVAGSYGIKSDTAMKMEKAMLIKHTHRNTPQEEIYFRF